MIGKIIDLPKIIDPRGNLTVAEEMTNVPLKVSRVYSMYQAAKAVEDMLISIAVSSLLQ